MIEEKDLMPIGKFMKPHALKGELNALCEVDLDILEEGYPLIVSVEGIYVPFYVESCRPKGTQSALIKLEGVDSADEARPFVNKEIFMMRRDVAEFFDMDEDELVLEDDLVGYEVYDRKAGFIGTVTAVDTSTDNVLLEITHAPGRGDETLFIPFADDFVEEIRHAGEEDGEEAGDNDGERPLPAESTWIFPKESSI